MKTTIYIACVLAAAGVLPTAAAPDMGEVWNELPQTIVPTLERNRRLDMTDLYHAGQKAKAETLLGGEAEITAMGDSYIAVRLSESNTLQIKRIAGKKGVMYAVIRTFHAPAANSRIELYDGNWQPLPVAKYVTVPDVDDFIATTANREQRREVNAALLIATYAYTMNEASNDITVKATFDQTLDGETYARLRPLLATQLTLQWTGKRWSATPAE